MTKKLWIVILIGLTALALSACGGESESSAQENAEIETGAPVVEKAENSSSDDVQLSTDYSDALSLDGQLAIGTVQLDDTELAVDEGQAANLLPLWQAYQSLSDSDTTAGVELEAVLNQIRDIMSADQISAIAEMQLTNDRLTELVEEGAIAFGRGGSRGAGGEGDESGFRGLGGGLPGQGAGGAAGSLPGGRPGEGSGSFSEDDIATRQAQFAEGGFGDFQGRLLTGVVIRSLQQKTGDTPEPDGIFAAIYDVIAEETGLTDEELQELTNAGETLAEIIEANGADVEIIQEMIIEAMGDSDQFRGQDLEGFLESFFEGSQE